MQKSIFKQIAHQTWKQMGYSSIRSHWVPFLLAKNRKPTNGAIHANSRYELIRNEQQKIGKIVWRVLSKEANIHPIQTGIKKKSYTSSEFYVFFHLIFNKYYV